MVDLKLEIEVHYEPLLAEIHKRISKWLEDYRLGLWGKTYESKNIRVAKVEAALEDIPLWVLISVASNNPETLQTCSARLGSYLEDETILAIKTGAEILSICDGLGFGIERPVYGEGNTFMVHCHLDRLNEVLVLQALEFYPMPELAIPDCPKSNAQVLLGHRENRHSNPINMSVLAILSTVGYKLTDIAKDVEPKPEGVRTEDWDNYLEQCEIVKETLGSKPFYFKWAYDKRGRVYSRGYHVNVQANEFHKACLAFSKSVDLTDRGWYWLKVDIANAFGLDKEVWDKRVAFVDSNIDAMLADIDAWSDKADDPLLAKSALLTYRESLVTSKSSHIVRLDATTSGPQLMSVMTRDIEGMQRFNVIGSSARRDFYTEVAQAIYDQTRDSKLWGETPSFKNIRKDIKASLMTYFYNSEANPKAYFGEDSKELKVFYDVMATSAKGAVELKGYINSLWSDTKLYNAWYLPDGHYAYCPVMVQDKKRVEIKEMKGGTATMTVVCDVNKPSHEPHRSLMPHVVHSVDALMMRWVVEILNDQGIQVSPIHDSFGVHAEHCDALREAYRKCLARLYKEDILGSILRQIQPDAEFELPEYDPAVYEAIRNNTDGYYIC
jgi:DNA-directed RNA polymerase|nr:MAG TPA: DNA directed RNA polymerase [Caudoviricetes sp.]